MLHDSFAFLSPALFGETLDLSDAGFDLESLGGHYQISSVDGVQFFYGSRTGAALVQVNASLSPPLEELSPMARRFHKQDSTLEAREAANMQTLLATLDLPLHPGMALSKAFEVCETRFRSLLVARSQEHETNERTVMYRSAWALSGSVLLYLQFRNDCLSTLELTDLALALANDHMDHEPKAWRDQRRQDAVDAAKRDPQQAALKHLHGVTQDTVEWQREFPVPAASAPKHDPVSEALNQQGFMLPEALQNIDYADMDMDDFDGVMQSSAIAAMRQAMLKEFGNARAMVEKAPSGELFYQCTNWLGRSVKPLHPEPLTLARMADCLGDLHNQLVCGGGLEGWLTCCLDASWDVMKALQTIQASGMMNCLASFTTRASQEGCDVMNQDAWELYFSQDARLEDEREAHAIALALPDEFRKWLLAQPGRIEQEDSEIEARMVKLKKPTRPATDARGMFASMLGSPMMHALKGMTSLISRESPNLNFSFDSTFTKLASVDQQRLREKYGSLEELIANCPIKRLFSNTASYGGYVSGHPVDDLSEPIRTAACLSSLQAETELLGLDHWFENCWDSQGHYLLPALKALGDSTLAPRLEQLANLPQTLGCPINEEHTWTDFSFDHPEQWPEQEEVLALLSPMRNAFRARWANSVPAA
jgi:hypothetical protein